MPGFRRILTADHWQNGLKAVAASRKNLSSVDQSRSEEKFESGSEKEHRTVVEVAEELAGSLQRTVLDELGPPDESTRCPCLQIK